VEEPEQSHVAVLMFIAQRHVERRILDFLAGEGFDDLTLAQGRVAARVSEDGLRLTDLAEQAQITKQACGALVDQLEKTGYVERVPDPTDARARLVRLAARGREAQSRARLMEQQIDEEWERRLGRRRMAGLRRALADLREITDPWA
jgi:DNA-binding MarR family transcriptional regulator